MLFRRCHLLWLLLLEICVSGVEIVAGQIVLQDLSVYFALDRCKCWHITGRLWLLFVAWFARLWRFAGFFRRHGRKTLLVFVGFVVELVVHAIFVINFLVGVLVLAKTTSTRASTAIVKFIDTIFARARRSRSRCHIIAIVGLLLAVWLALFGTSILEPDFDLSTIK